MSAAADQKQLAEEFLDELECCGDVGEVSLLMVLDALACGRLALVRSHDMEASQAFMGMIAPEAPDA